MKEENIFPLIKNLIKTAHTSQDIKEDLFQDLYLYHLQLEKRYIPTLNVPLEAFLKKFLRWRMWALIKKEYSVIANSVEDFPDYREENTEDITLVIEGLSNISDSNKTLLIYKHCLNKSYRELSQLTGLSVEGIRKKLNKIERNIKWVGTNKEMMRKEK